MLVPTKLLELETSPVTPVVPFPQVAAPALAAGEFQEELLTT